MRGVSINQPLAAEPFDVARILLMRSVLRPSGATHEEVMVVELYVHE
jgi:hypothetical protein